MTLMKTFRPSLLRGDGVQTEVTSSLGGMSSGADAEESHGSPAPEELLVLARRISAARNRRKKYLAGELFAEPGWEMLLALYEADAAGHRRTVSNLCYSSKAPDTTALRWLDKLSELNLVRRSKNPLDARMVFIELEPCARNAIQSYLCELWVDIYGTPI